MPANRSIPEKSTLSTLALKPDNSVPPHVSLALLELLPQHWTSESVSPHKSVYGSFKEELPGTPEASISLSLNPHWFLQPELMGTSLPGTGGPGWGARFGAGTPCSSTGTSAPKLCLPVYNHHTWVWDQPFLLLHPFFQSQCGCFFIFTVIGLLFSWISAASPGWFLYNVVVILLW